LFNPTKSYRKALKDNLVLKSVASEQDIERVAAFHGVIHDQGVAGMVRELILHHPNTRPEHWLYVEDEETEQVVSSLCLIPWTWRYQGVEIKAGEMGIVGTLDAYRRRGLIRALVARFKELLRKGGYDLIQIQGIPYFYRQFGYEYAMPLEGGWHIQLHQIADPPEGEAAPYTFRLATAQDTPALVRLYDDAAQDLDIHAARSEAEWRYLFGPSTKTEMDAQTWLMMDEQDQVVGYARVPKGEFGKGLIVNEVSRLSPEVALAALRFFKKLSIERGNPYVRLNVPQACTLIQTARYLGAHDAGRYAWQIHLVDVACLLRKLAPVFERRIAASSLAGLSKTVCLNLYREAFDLRFERGKLAAVEALGFRDGGHIRLPPLLLAPLLLGYKSRQELADTYPDFSAGGENQLLVEILFPKVESFIYTVY
jgi:GNAT superfamily N-acetyltransferase